jgi:Zinc finger C-x8-C-x5-C-x3-H type (and similar)/RNA-binding, Nab2-type zinc finger
LPIESPIAPKPSDSPRKKVCKHYRQGHCQLEKDCQFSHPQAQQTKSLIKVPDTSTNLSCRLDSPLDRPIGEEADNTSLDAHPPEFEGDTIVHNESQDKMDQAPSYSHEFNGNHPDPDQPTYDDQAYEEQLNVSPPNPRHNKTSGPASYYGDGWEERSPPPPLATRLQAPQRVALHVPSPPKYPHVSEIIPHWTQFADPHANKDVPFCKQLAQGGCSQGDRCRFRHSLTVEEYILLFNDHQPNLWTLQRDGVNEAAVSSPASAQPQVDSPHISSAVVVRSSTFDQECKFYPIGKCRNGDLCPFQHTQHPIAAATASNANQDGQASELPTFCTQNFRRPCKYYLERGYCSRGLSCKFGHGDHPDGDHPSSGPSGPESTPSVVDDEKSWSTSREGNKANDNSDADTPVEDNGWGTAAATGWDVPSNPEDHSAWYSPGGNDHSHQPRPRKSNACFQYAEGHCHRGEACKYSHDQEFSNKSLSSEVPKTEDNGWPPDESSHSAPRNTAPPVQCPYYPKGNCRNGSFCHMSHDFEEKPQEECHSAESYKVDQPTNKPGEIVQNGAQSTWEAEGEPKAQEGDCQDSHILENEASWSEPWPTETVQLPPFPTKIDAPCKRFGQGYCPLGDDCVYLHIGDTDIVEYTSNSEADVLVSVSLKRSALAL